MNKIVSRKPRPNILRIKDPERYLATGVSRVHWEHIFTIRGAVRALIMQLGGIGEIRRRFKNSNDLQAGVDAEHFTETINARGIGPKFRITLADIPQTRMDDPDYKEGTVLGTVRSTIIFEIENVFLRRIFPHGEATKNPKKLDVTL